MLLGRQALSDIVLRENERSGLAEVLVPAGVITVPVGVEPEADLPACNLLDFDHNLGTERRELVVDEEGAVLDDDESDVAACAVDHEDASRRLRHLELDGDRVGVLSSARPS